MGISEGEEREGTDRSRMRKTTNMTVHIDSTVDTCGYKS